MSDIKISATHFAKGVEVVYLASRQKNEFFRLAVVKIYTNTCSSSPEHHLTLLLPFLPLTVDSTCCVYYFLNLQCNWVVGCQVEVKNGLKCVYCVDCVG